MKYIAIINTDEPFTEHTIQDIKNTIFCGGEQASYAFEIEDIKNKSEGEEKMITVVQARELQRLTKKLWMLLSQEQYKEIIQIFQKAVDEEIAYQEGRK